MTTNIDMRDDAPAVKPITPDQVGALKAKTFPSAVFEAFNAEIAAKFTNGRANVLQKDVVARLEAAGIERKDVFAKGYLNVEEVYREAGWKVTYDKPAYNESYDASFEFKR